MKNLFSKHRIFRKKPLLYIWLIINFLLFWGSTMSLSRSIEGLIISFFVTLIIYIIIINFALSDIMEKFLIHINDARRLATNREKDRLNDLFSEVHENAKVRSRCFNEILVENVQLYIQDTMSVNAFALGRNTIIVTKGLMDTMNDDEIKGVLAHEFAHIARGDTQIRLLVTIASTIYTWVFLVIRTVFVLLENIETDKPRSTSIFSLIAMAIRICLDVIVIYFTFLGNLALMKYYRDTEYKADEYTYLYNKDFDGLISALYKLYDMQVSDKKKLVDRMMASHPRTAFRIEKMEKLNHHTED